MRSTLTLLGVVLLTAAATAVRPLETGDAFQVAIAARAQQPGDVVVLTIAAPASVETISVRALGRAIPTFPTAPGTWQALLGLDIDVHPGRDEILVEGRERGAVRRQVVPLTVQPHRFPTRTLRVDPSFVNPPPELLERITEEAKLLEGLWRASSSSRLWDGQFVQPVPAPASGRFGARSIFNGEPRSRHAGEDFPSPEGTPVMAPNAGRVVLARDLYFAGNTVVIDHGLGFFSLLEHLSVIQVKEGDRIQIRQAVGLVGATGRVTGPHLHWAVRINGARVDPLSILATVGR